MIRSTNHADGNGNGIRERNRSTNHADGTVIRSTNNGDDTIQGMGPNRRGVDMACARSPFSIFRGLCTWLCEAQSGFSRLDNGSLLPPVDKIWSAQALDFGYTSVCTKSIFCPFSGGYVRVEGTVSSCTWAQEFLH